MPRGSSSTGSELFIVDKSNADWKVLRYLHDWCQLSDIRRRVALWRKGASGTCPTEITAVN